MLPRYISGTLNTRLDQPMSYCILSSSTVQINNCAQPHEQCGVRTMMSSEILYQNPRKHCATQGYI